MTQSVIEPTFRLDNATSTNTLDLIFTECPERICNGVNHFPPLGQIDKAHHILKWNFNLHTANNNISKPRVIRLFKHGDYEQMSNYFSNIDWLSIFIEIKM